MKRRQGCVLSRPMTDVSRCVSQDDGNRVLWHGNRILGPVKLPCHAHLMW